MNEPTLHPNLAKLAAAYDEILEQHARNQISPVSARARIAQLEARDDEGVRWSIDPDTGDWVRKTALGDYEYDAAPPAQGYMTADAFDYTHDPRAFNPADRIQLAAVNDHLEHAPTSLAGATRHLERTAPSSGLPALLGKVTTAAAAASTRVKAVTVAGAVLALSLLVHACSAPATTPAPTPAPTAKTAPAHHAPAPARATVRATKRR